VQLTAVVDRVDDDGRMELGCLDAKRAAALRPNLAVTLEYFREGAVFKIRTAVVEIGPAPDPSDVKARRQVIVGPPQNVNKIQRRRFTRAFVSVFVSFAKIDDPGDDFDITSKKGKKQAAKWAAELEGTPHQAFTETMSGSGLRMRIDVFAKKGDHLYVQLELPDHPVNAVGEVVWLGTKPPQEVPGEAVGIDFKSISEEDRQAILDFVEGHKRR
jgi:hypothetical protein